MEKALSRVTQSLRSSGWSSSLPRGKIELASVSVVLSRQQILQNSLTLPLSPRHTRVYKQGAEVETLNIYEQAVYIIGSKPDCDIELGNPPTHTHTHMHTQSMNSSHLVVANPPGLMRCAGPSTSFSRDGMCALSYNNFCCSSPSTLTPTS